MTVNDRDVPPRPDLLWGDDLKFSDRQIWWLAAASTVMAIAPLAFLANRAFSIPAYTDKIEHAIPESVKVSEYRTRSGRTVSLRATLADGTAVEFSHPEGYVAAVASTLSTGEPVKLLLEDNESIREISKRDANGRWVVVVGRERYQEWAATNDIWALVLSVVFALAAFGCRVMLKRRNATRAWDDRYGDTAHDG